MAEIGSVTVDVKVEPTKEFDAAARALGYAKERTCRFELDETGGERRCSSCGEFVTQHSVDEEYFVTELTAEMFEHCPFCGAKAVYE